MASKYIIYKFYLHRFIGGKEERMSAEECAQTIDRLLPEPGKKNALKIVGRKTKRQRQGRNTHGNKMEQHQRNIASLLVEANKTKEITRDFDSFEEEHNPFLRFLFDCTPEHCLMAVERNESTMSEKKAVELIKLMFNQNLWDEDWQFECVQPNIPMEYWDILKFVIKKLDDQLRKVSLVFDDNKQNVNKKNEGKAGLKKDKLEFIDEFVSHFRKGGLSFDLDDNIQMEHYKSDILHLAALCAERDYQLVAEFRNFGKMCYTNRFPAIMPLDNEVLGEFLGRKAETSMNGYKIEKWFNNIHELFYEQEEMNDDERRRSGMDIV